MPLRRSWLVIFAVLVASLPATTAAAEEAAQGASYEQELAFLKSHTQVLELSSGKARLAVCPKWQGRIFVSTCDGLAGPSFGWVNHEFIKAGKPSLVFNNYGGADRFWISPEAGQFAMFFAPGSEQTLPNWLTQTGLNEGGFEVLSSSTSAIKMKRRVPLTNYSGTKFDLEVERNVSLLPESDYATLYGAEGARQLANPQLQRVGFASENRVINRGEPTTKAKGLISIWTIGQFKPGPHTVIIVPYQPGEESELGPAVTPDYFGPVPANRLKVTESAVLFLGDGHFRAKLGVSPKRSKGVAGSYNFDENVLTIVSFPLPKDAAKQLYIDNRWKLPLADPYHGDTFNSYNDGPPEPGAATMGGFYELETLSPARELAAGDSVRHVHRTLHVRGDMATLAGVAKAILGVDLKQVKAAMFE